LVPIINAIEKDPDATELKWIREELRLLLSEMIQFRFNELVQLLYTIDINEQELKSKLTRGQDAGEIIADLIIARQLKKNESRKNFPSTKGIPDNESW
jgi:hypothetical protein